MSERAGTPALPEDLIDVDALLDAYHGIEPDLSDPAQHVVFGTSGHRGSSLNGSFNEAHIAAITAAIIEYRRQAGIGGPLFLGRDTHALSEPALVTALEVLAAAGVPTFIDDRDGFTPTPALSHAILRYNRNAGGGAQADGIVITPSHNPPADGGFKYNPPHGGPAGTEATGWIAARANELLTAGWTSIPRTPFTRAYKLDNTTNHPYLHDYVDDLPQVLDIDAIRASGLHIGADPLGGASVDYWAAIAERHDLNLTVVNPAVDPTWAFMTLDWDGKIRMDCSSPAAMASLISARDDYDIATGNDADADRHGIVTPDAGLMNPNHYLAVAIGYLFSHRPGWPATAKVGKTLVSSSVIDRVTTSLGRELYEVPVGFKWFVDGLLAGELGFGGEESAGASFLRRDGGVWTTDKDGILLALLASEITAVTGSTPSQHYAGLVERYGEAAYARTDAPASREQKAALKDLSPEQISDESIAGEPIVAALTRAPGNDAEIGGLKVVTENAWFAARPSGTEDVYKIYAESLKGAEHLSRIQDEATRLVSRVIES
ncbi:phosphoglucomutase (alpha-D-glucose-1,6-bisphosphate-dependent) [Sediminivirga luteola]|uniref:phosphoglucomutase (alpha-D-glucose-1,6-bisphosphate-dependent) n=1 Tax=Sediminivirga luteola TaxID=1774748 RepID=UPI001F5AAFDA|nr:phosphoglucomutase (alpha-D-glucose-1,6-bisphosphate-dependent) [Sediminivirga luteola]MCI2264392.1 phosphoglucomutase (alpha-D-glucose-1,6-bisphosphate-dependent) [Sediminivirga luteola]